MIAYELAGPILAADDDVRARAWVLGDRVTYERPSHASIERLDGWVIPGMVDMHCHLSVGPSGPVDADLTLKHAHIQRDAGVLLIRDTGSSTGLDVLAGRPDVPVVQRSGRFIARPKRYLPGYAVEIEPGHLEEQVRIEARASGAWVKLIADWIDRSMGSDADLAPLWEPQELAAAVAAAHEEGALVTAHTFSTEAVDALLDAGIDSIEHGTGMTPDHMERAATEGVPVIPTLLQVANFEAFAAQGASKYPRFAHRMMRMHSRRYEQVRLMHEAGVTILLGTDAGTSVGHGELAREAAELGTCMPATDVVAAATWRARRFLGAPVLDEGDVADLVLLPGDPRQQLGHLAAPSAVFLRGQRVL